MGHEHATWGQLLKRCRLQQKVSIPAAAKCTGTTEDEWDFFELGEMWPDGQTRGRISRAFKGMRIHETLCIRERNESVVSTFAEAAKQAADGNCPPRYQALARRVVPGGDPGDPDVAKAVTQNVLATLETPSPVAANKPSFAPLALPKKEKPLDLSGVAFHLAIRAARRHNRLSQEEVAALLDVGSSTITRWESNEDVPIEQHYSKIIQLLPELEAAQKPSARAITKPGVPRGVSTRPPSPDCSLSPDQIAALSPKETPAPMANPAQDSFKDGIKFATLLGSLATGRDGARVLEMLQIAKQRGLSIDDVIASMQEAGR